MSQIKLCVCAIETAWIGIRVNENNSRREAKNIVSHWELSWRSIYQFQRRKQNVFLVKSSAYPISRRTMALLYFSARDAARRNAAAGKVQSWHANLNVGWLTKCQRMPLANTRAKIAMFVLRRLSASLYEFGGCTHLVPLEPEDDAAREAQRTADRARTLRRLLLLQHRAQRLALLRDHLQRPAKTTNTRLIKFQIKNYTLKNVLN